MFSAVVRDFTCFRVFSNSQRSAPGGTDLCKNHRFIKENKVQILGFCCIPGPTCDFEIEGDPTIG